MAHDDELAQMQRLSNDYVPEDTGPLVGERQSTTELTAEYANGDPIYRTKTAALPRKYAFYRRCRGDGHCGWRAIAFSYFETLIRVADVGKLDVEQVRLKSMQNLLNAAGHSDDIVGDFAEETFGLMQELAILMTTPNSDPCEHLLRNFNDYSRSMAIVTHFKLLASAWIQAHPDDYLPFVLDYPDLKSYCEENFERAVCEIDHVGVAALSEAVVKPAGFALEVLYLDRSPGDEINHTYRAEPLAQEGFPITNPPTLRLLYRPGHYDVLYRAEDFPVVIPPQAPIQVALVGQTGRYDPGAIAAPIHDYSDLLLSIPGAKMWEAQPTYDFNLNPSPPPQVVPVSSYAPVPTPAPPPAEPIHDFVPPPHAPQVNSHPAPRHHSIQLEQPVALPVHPPPPMSLERGLPMTIERTEPFRPSAYTLEPGFGANQMHALPFQTSIFRNSHYNTAHFLNPDFQPEEWSPGAEYATSNRGRHKSASQ
ncbi:cysteine proteinase [Westerdykella ornata]|uniref:ubiquitinyl hydrolase 1 n=1 Tax=Westerdykella ornata TaxID=318751 RepID=A0A6A6JDE6_WESOR|nr:cysteine proteinase [Westerdykella ornata]KAF2273646.1 cysteine proteinase [Westerdykella ornata]